MKAEYPALPHGNALHFIKGALHEKDQAFCGCFSGRYHGTGPAHRLRRQRLPRLGGRTPGFWAACGLGGLFLLIALLAALDFDGAFTVFHSIFFPGKDNWLFDPVTDPVILILPEAFFRNCAIAIVTVLLTVCIVLVVTGRKRPSRRSAPGEGTAS